MELPRHSPRNGFMSLYVSETAGLLVLTNQGDRQIQDRRELR